MFFQQQMVNVLLSLLATPTYPHPSLFSGLQQEELGGHHPSPASPLSGGSVKIKHYCVRSGGDGVKSTHHSYLILMGLELCFFLATMFKQTLAQSVAITSPPDSELSQIKIKSCSLQWKESPAETFDNPRVGLVLLCCFTDPQSISLGLWTMIQTETSLKLD